MASRLCQRPHFLSLVLCPASSRVPRRVCLLARTLLRSRLATRNCPCGSLVLSPGTPVPPGERATALPPEAGHRLSGQARKGAPWRGHTCREPRLEGGRPARPPWNARAAGAQEGRN